MQRGSYWAKNACEYGDHAMDFIDQKVHNESENTIMVPRVWVRLRDDIYMAWKGTIEQLERFMKWLNGICPGLVFTHSYSPDGTDFTDLHIYDIDSVIHTKLFRKGGEK